MEQILSNHQITLAIDLPLEGYQASRFDWTGKITQVSFKGKTVAGQEAPDCASSTDGAGFYNEFGIDQPVGFDQAKRGDWFQKIGIGLLKKDGSIYDFSKEFETRPANFQFQKENDRITLTCQSELCNGYAYVLIKEIQLTVDGFQINYQLENLGEKIIETTEYTHNFLNLNQSEIGKDYILSFPFDLQTNQFGETVNPEQLVHIGKREIGFKDRPSEPFFFSNLSGSQTVEAFWRLENRKSKIGISETGDFDTSLINVWGMGHVISPELFKYINLAPTSMARWKRTYRIFDL